MKKIIFTQCFMVIFAIAFAQTGNTWTQKADFGGLPRNSAVGFSIGNKGYIGTGANDWGGPYYKDFWEFDQATNAWSQKADFGGSARFRAVGFSIGYKGYLGTGTSADQNNLKDFWEYDPGTNIWTRKADIGGATGRYSAIGFSIGQKGYVGTGDIATYPPHSKDFWEYDPATDTWIRKADFGGAGRQYAAAFVVNGKGYVGTGYNDSRLNDFWEYNPSTNTWVQKANFIGSNRLGAVAFSIGNIGYLGSGEGNSSNYNDFYAYDPTLNTWTQKKEFGGAAIDRAVGFSIDNNGFIGTGWDRGRVSYQDFWEYTPNAISTGPPTITSFSPTSGPVGTSVTINGTNFGTNPADNIVYFGATKATVTAASATSLTVTIPAGATYLPVTVTTNNLSAYSAAPFIVTFNNGGGGFNANSFAAPLEFATNSGGSFGVLPGDLDGDGKADIVVNNLLNGNMSVFGNTSVSGTISFSSAAVYTVIGNGQYPGNKTVDLDGDGKLDLAVANQQVSSISVFRNTSTTGNIALGAKIDFTTGTAPADLAFGDIDGDGKTDMVTADIDVNKFSVLLNTGTPGNISFAAKVDFSTSANPRSLAISDVDGDGKPDIVIINIFGTNTLSVFRNTSTAGVVSFAAKVDFPSYGGDAYISAGDIDGDNKPDIVVADVYSDAISVFRNTCTTGNISFDSYRNYTTAPGPYYVSIGDLDGDGKPDIAVAHNTGTIMSVLKNTSIVGTISLGTPVTYKVSSSSVIPQSLAICDIDNDGKPDIALAGWAGNSLYVLRNLAGDGGCSLPKGLAVKNVTDISAKLVWTPNTSIKGFFIIYRPVNSTVWIERRTLPSSSHLLITGLIPNTTYKWRIRSVCSNDVSSWVKGSDFTTAASYAAFSNDANNSNVNVPGKTALQITPNPGKGNFTLQMQLPAKAAATTIALYNSLGVKVWQQQAGQLSGAVTKSIALENKLATGIYVLYIERSDIKLEQKIVVSK